MYCTCIVSLVQPIVEVSGEVPPDSNRKGMKYRTIVLVCEDEVIDINPYTLDCVLKIVNSVHS